MDAVEINLTLLIQIVHFLIAYLLLRVFLWRPIVNYLQEEARHKASLNDELKKQQQIVEQKQFDLVKIKDEAAQAFAASLPPLPAQTAGVRKGPLQKTQLQVPTLSADQIKQAVQIITQKVEE